MQPVKHVYLTAYEAHGHVWVYTGTADRRHEVMQAVGREAADHDSPFNWHDAVAVHSLIRQEWPAE